MSQAEGEVDRSRAFPAPTAYKGMVRDSQQSSVENCMPIAVLHGVMSSARVTEETLSAWRLLD
jgi:hypothetical protein